MILKQRMREYNNYNTKKKKRKKKKKKKLLQYKIYIYFQK